MVGNFLLPSLPTLILCRSLDFRIGVSCFLFFSMFLGQLKLELLVLSNKKVGLENKGFDCLAGLVLLRQNCWGRLLSIIYGYVFNLWVPNVCSCLICVHHQSSMHMKANLRTALGRLSYVPRRIQSVGVCLLIQSIVNIAYNCDCSCPALKAGALWH